MSVQNNYIFLLVFKPIESISSINITLGAFFLAFLKNFLILEAPSPTNISSNSEPFILKNDTPASPAKALARSVFPVPGSPLKSIPLEF